MTKAFDLDLYGAKGDRLFVIAEAGVNHNGDLDLAFRLVDAAVEAGCDAVKFQTWITEKVYSRARSIKADYQKSGADDHDPVYDTIKQLELSPADFHKIKAYCDKRGILFFSTPDEMDSARALVELGVSLMKTASQDVTNLPFLAAIGRLGLPVIYSTGASTLAELTAGAGAILAVNPKLAILHCISSYPAPLEEMNLSFIPTLASMFGVPVGLSDHTTGVEAACAALALGARIFEKHLTLDREMPGPDHKASLDPAQMSAYVATLRALHKGLGDGRKRIMPCEENTRLAFRRFIVAEHDLAAGHHLTEEDILFKKVGAGLAPDSAPLLLGARLKAAVAADTPLSLDMFEWD